MSVSKVPSTPPPISAPCAVCQKVTKLTCGRCKLVFFCSKECIGKNWSQHKITCLTPEARQERTTTILEENEQLMKSRTFQEVMGVAGLAPKLSEFHQLERQIRQLIAASPDRGILSQLIDKVFPLAICEKKLQKSWKKLTPEERQNRSQKYQEILQKFQKLEELKSKGKEPQSIVMPIQMIRDGAKAILNMSVHPNSNVDMATIRAAANTVFETLPLIEASPDVDMIAVYCSRAVSSLVLESDLKVQWMKLSPEEAARRKAVWQKIAPHYEPCVQALMLLQNQALNHFVSKS